MKTEKDITHIITLADDDSATVTRPDGTIIAEYNRCFYASSFATKDAMDDGATLESVEYITS